MAHDVFIWLGAETEFAANQPKFAGLPSDEWTSGRPLFRWKRTDATPANDAYTFAVLGRATDLTRAALAALGGEVQTVAGLPAEWAVWEFPRSRFTGAQLAAATPAVAAIAAPPGAAERFVLRKPTAATKVEVPAATGVVATDKGTLELTVAADAAAELTLTLKIKSVLHDSVKVNQAVAIAYSTAGGLTLNGVPLAPSEPSTPLGDEARLVKFGTGGSRVRLEVPVKDGTYSVKPFLDGIDESSVLLNWKKLVVRLSRDGIELAAPDADPSAEILAATITIPLIRATAAISSETDVPLLAPLRPAGATTDVLAALTVVVSLHKPAGGAAGGPSPAPALAGSAADAEGALARAAIDLNAAAGKARLAVGVLRTLEARLLEVKTPAHSLSALGGTLAELTGNTADGLEFLIEKGESLIGFAESLKTAVRGSRNFPVPLRLTVKVGGAEKLTALVVFRIDLWTGRLGNNRAYFFVAKEGDTSPWDIDLLAFAVRVPVRNYAGSSLEEDGLPQEDDHDGYIDFGADHSKAGDLVLDYRRKSGARPQVEVFFPGNLDKFKPEEHARLRLKLDDFNPDTWPTQKANDPDRIQLRLGSSGLTLYARADTTTAGRVKDKDNPEVALALQLVEERPTEGDRAKSELVVIRNRVRYAWLHGRFDVPGFDRLQADVTFSLRQKAPEAPPEVHAEFAPVRPDQAPLGRLRIPFLQIRLDALRLGLTWDPAATHPWKLDAFASGAASFSKELASPGGLTGLDDPKAIPFRDLNLLALHRSKSDHPLVLGGQRPGDSRPADPARFEFLNGLFTVEFDEARLEWDVDPATRRGAASIDATNARFRFKSSGQIDVAVRAGRIRLGVDYQNGFRVRLKFPSALGLDVKIGTQIRFSGAVEWRDDEAERYLAAGGRLDLPGFPSIGGMLKIGTGVKADGSTAPNLAVFGELAQDADLFAGVVLKRIGVGLGVNNRLRAFGPRPEPREILTRIDDARPTDPSAWGFVTDRGVYVSVVATCLLGSNRGAPKLVNAYLASLVLSIDTNLDVVAAGKLWLFSSPQYVADPDHAARPVAVAAVAFRPRQQTLSLVAETRPRPALEANEQLAQILSAATARFSFFLSPQLADFYLEEVGYRTELFGVGVQVRGSFRLAVGGFGMLMRAGLGVRGVLPERAYGGPAGGFSFSGSLQLDADFGGLVSARGLAAYGSVSASLGFRVSAYVLAPGIAWQTIHFKRTISFSVTIGYLQCKRWRCRWKTETIRRSYEIDVSATVAVPVMKRYEMRPQSLELLIAGELGFNESGQFGFAGTVGISTSVCGFPLRIAPSFHYRREVVDGVRRRVAEIEGRLNELRNVPRPANSARVAGLSLAPEAEAVDDAAAETWFYYAAERGGKTYHLFVPSPENPDWWYAPRKADLTQYANLPRDQEVAADKGGASAVEREHLSPLRDAVMRIAVPLDDGGWIDLAMPWDRGNMDALPPDSPDDPEKRAIALRELMRLAEAEAQILDTALDESAADVWEELGFGAGAAGLTGVVIVSDPRPELNLRTLWTTADQLERPDYAPPYRYRPVAELAAEGFAGVGRDRRGDIDRMVLFERVSQLAAAQDRHEQADPTPARRALDARGAFLAAVLDDFRTDGGPTEFGMLKAIEVEREQNIKGVGRKASVTRRRLPILLRATEDGGATYLLELNRATLSNATDFGLQTEFDLEITWDYVPGDDAPPGEVVTVPPAGPFTGTEVERAAAEIKADFETLAAHSYDGAKSMYTVLLKRKPKAPGPDAERVTTLIVIPVPKPPPGPGAPTIDRRVGLIFETEPGVKPIPEQIRVYRNEPDSAPANPVAWCRERPVRVVAMSEGGARTDPVRRWVTPLPAGQEFVPAAAGRPKVRIKLPVRYHDELLRSHLPRLNRFAVYRKLPADRHPVLVADNLFPCLTRVIDPGDPARTVYLLVRPFLLTDEYEYDPATGLFAGLGTEVRPDATGVAYYLRAIPHGPPPDGGFPPPTADNRPDWIVVPHVPAARDPLPPLGVVFRASDLIDRPDTDRSAVPFRLIDGGGREFDWGARVRKARKETPASAPPVLELWAEPWDIRGGGSYAVSDVPSVPQPDARPPGPTRPSDTAAERLPESVDGKVLLGTFTDDGPLAVSFRADGVVAGSSYRLLVRERIATAAPLARVAPVFLCREFPPRFDEHTALVPAGNLELVSRTEYERITVPLDGGDGRWLTRGQARVTRIPADAESGLPLGGLRVSWDFVGGGGADGPHLDGGVEVLIQDADEGHWVERVEAEAYDEQTFQTLVRDLRDPSPWQAHPDSRPGWVAGATPALPDADLSGYYLWTHERNALLEQGGKARETLVDLLAEENAPWWAIHRALDGWFTALFAWRRSPLALDTQEERDGLDRMIACGRHLILGLKIGPRDSADTPVPLSAYEDAETRLDQVLDEIAKADPRSDEVRDHPTEYDKARERLTDYDVASRLAQIVTRRRAIADEFLVPGVADFSLNAEPDETMPRFTEWVTLYERWVLATRPGSADAPPAPMPLSTKLLGPESTGLFEAGRQTRAVEELRALVTRFPDPYRMLQPGTTEPGVAYRERAAGVVAQAAGLTAAVDALRRDAEARGWQLVRRPHSQVTVGPAGGGDGRAVVEVLVGSLLPDFTRAADSPAAVALDDLSPEARAGSVGFFFNLMERLGFAVDLAAVTDKNLPLTQTGLLDWVARVNLPSAIDPAQPPCDLFLVTVREPDTRAADHAVGHSFVKLAAVPKAFLDPLLRPFEVTAGAAVSAAETITIKVAPKTQKHLLDAGFADKDGLVVETVDGTVIGRGKWTKGPDTATDLVLTEYEGADVPAVTLRLTADARTLRQLTPWYKLRSVKSAPADADALAEAAIVRLMAEATVAAAAARPRADAPDVYHVVLEPRGRRWQTVPESGGRCHLHWPSSVRVGQGVRVAVRRVSRYEPLLRWLDRDAVPVVGRIYGLGDDVVTPVDFPRRGDAAREEPTALPVTVQPHPTEVRFVYPLPSAGSRALVSAVSAIRTGYRGCELAFGHRLVQHRDAARALGAVVGAIKGPIGRVARVRLKSSAGGGKVWAAESAVALPPGTGVLLVRANRGETATARAVLKVEADTDRAITFDPAEQKPPVVDESDEAADAVHVLIKTWPAGSKAPRQDVLRGEATANGAGAESTGFVVLTVEGGGPLPTEDDAYAGAVVLIIDGDDRRARVVKSYAAAARRFTFTEPLHAAVADRFGFQLLTGTPPTRQDPVPQPEPPPPTLFRHERQVTLPDLPFYREYMLAAGPRFEIEPVLPSAPPPATPPPPVAWARRRPSCLGVKPVLAHVPNLRPTTPFVRVDLTLYLSRHRDHLTPAECRAAVALDGADAVAPSTDATNGWPGWRAWPARDLPDLATWYQLLWKVPPGTAAPEPGETEAPAYVVGLEAALPWSGAGNPGPGRAEVRTRFTDLLPVKLKNGETEADKATAVLTPDVQVWWPTSGAAPVFQVAATFYVSNTSGLFLPGFYKLASDTTGNQAVAGPSPYLFVRAYRDGVPGRIVPVVVQPL